MIAVQDGLVARKDTYLDLVAYQRQAGAIPEGWVSTIAGMTGQPQPPASGEAMERA